MMFEDLQTRVRLKPFEIEAIQKIFAKHFLTTDHIWLFGSRANLSKRGGDIDLYVETTAPVDETLQRQSRFLDDLYEAIGEQKIDIVINTVNNSLDLPIYQKALQDGVQLL